MKILTVCTTPTKMHDDVARLWLQHVRDFDVMHQECHFEVLMQANKSMSIDEAIKLLGEVTPPIPVKSVIKKQGKESKK